MLTWADVGNGWRNLFLLSCAVQALGLGVFFAARRLVGKSRVASFLLGAAVTPLVQFLWMLLMGAVWAHAPKLLLIGAPPALAAAYLLVWLLRRLRRVPAMVKAAWRRGIRWFAMDRGGLICLTLALALTVVFLPICVRLCIQNNNTYTDAGEYLAMGQRYCEDRDLGALLSKDDGDGSFRPNSHFPAMELYFAYGLLHTSQGQVGYPYDKPVFTGIGLLLFYFAAAYGAALWLVTKGKPRWLALGVLLLNLVPDLYFSANGAPRDIYRLLATMALFGFLWSIRPDGSWKRMLGKAALWLIVCFACMATHVVMFVVLPFMVAAWVLFCFFEAWAQKMAHPWRTLGRAALLALAGAAGTVAAFAGNIACYLKTGEMSPFRLMTTYTSAPWFELYEKMEYRSTEASTTVNFFKSYNDVLMKWQTPIGVWAAALAVLIVVIGLIALLARRRRGLSENTSRLWGAALLLLLTLLPMTGLIDTPVYSFSGAFLKL
ncbi:MAG: hypothetical protein PHY12_03220, partial [Eubacteriales bacterium]|nr:hypothetical protein [Eubacteriales bacterium]